jgi:GTP-binding protein Era
MSTPPRAGFRTGLVALVGRTNVGKSTLLNALAGAKVSIVTPKPQTTRHSLHAVVHRPDAQIVLVDTPGFFRTHRSDLVDRLHARTRAALGGIDALVHVVDPSRAPGAEDEMSLQALKNIPQPRILCLNKSDLIRRPYRDHWLRQGSSYSAVVELSARTGAQIEGLIQALLPLLPVAPPLYEPGEITNAHRDFRIAEAIREKVYLFTGEEVPYRTAVRVDSVLQRPDGAEGLDVQATLLVAHPRYKAILIGSGGRMVKAIRRAAGNDLQRILGAPLTLALTVHVDARMPD